MSDERFVVSTNTVGEIIVTDVETGNVYRRDNISNFFGLIRLLNEQQVKIEKQDEEIKKLKRTERSWRRIHCCNKESDNCGIVIEQEATIKQLQDTVYDELDKALKVLEEIYEDYPKNNVHRLYNNLKGLKEMIR